jgi:hypothetical protein
MKKYEKYIGKEDQFQKTVARYLDSMGVVWMHPPNEIKAKVQYMAKRKAMGVKSGVPDILIFEPNKKHIGLAIELKAGYNKPSENQLKWIKDLNSLGWLAVWSNSLDEVIEIIEKYFDKSNR